MKRRGKRPILHLASRSPRRRAILRLAGFNLGVVTPRGVREEIRKGETPRRAALRLAREKVQAAVRRLPAGSLVVGADTMVSVAGKVLGKPRTRREAERMLRTLSGKSHRVVTGVVVRLPEGGIRMFSEETAVSFRKIPTAEIRAYVRTREPYDKAGGYAVQGAAAGWIRRIRGDYWNVVGLPLGELMKRLFRWGVLKK